MKKKILLFMLALSVNMFSQNKTCDTPKEDIIEDLSSITKCTVKSSKKTKNKRARQIAVKISASRSKGRFLKKRIAAKKAKVSSISGLESSSIANTSENIELSKSIQLKSNIKNITNKLSAEQVRKADKFTTVDVIPAFTDCKNAKKGEKMDCFNTEMIKHIQRHFEYPSDAILNKIEGDVWIRFIIDKDGSISNIKTLGPKNGKILDEEAKRVVSLLPKFIPATKEGKKVSVKYGFPISFNLSE